MPDRSRPRHFVPGSPFNASPEPEPPAEQYAVQDRVTHDRYGLGRILAVEDDTAVVVDFGSRVVRIRMPCPKMTKL
jgi:hypothetical protein